VFEVLFEFGVLAARKVLRRFDCGIIEGAIVKNKQDLTALRSTGRVFTSVAVFSWRGSYRPDRISSIRLRGPTGGRRFSATLMLRVPSSTEIVEGLDSRLST